MFYVTATAKSEEKAREQLADHFLSPSLPLVHHYKSPPDIECYDLWTFQVDDDDCRKLVANCDLGEHVSDVLPHTNLMQDAALIDLNA